MRQIEENDFPGGPIPPEQWADVLCLTFTIAAASEDDEIELSPGGGSREVTYENRVEYVELLRHYKLHQWDSQIAAMRQGLRDYRIFAPVFALWSAREMEVSLAG